MPATLHRPTDPFRWRRPVAALAMIFGVLTVVSGGHVLFGPAEAQMAAGDYVSFVVWFNFLAGWVYAVAAAGLWLGRTWAGRLAVFIAAATGLTALAFAVVVAQGRAFEMRTVVALAIRFAFWAGVAVLSRKRAQNS